MLDLALPTCRASKQNRIVHDDPFCAVCVLQLYCLDANAVAQEVGLGRRVNMVMQAAFFALSGVVDIKEVGINSCFYSSYLWL